MYMMCKYVYIYIHTYESDYNAKKNIITALPTWGIEPTRTGELTKSQDYIEEVLVVSHPS
jgi:hypothetical protein